MANNDNLQLADIFHKLMTIYRKMASIYYQDMTCIHDTTFNILKNKYSH